MRKVLYFNDGLLDDLDLQMEGFISDKGAYASPYKAVGTGCHARRGYTRLARSFDPCLVRITSWWCHKVLSVFDAYNLQVPHRFTACVGAPGFGSVERT